VKYVELLLIQTGRHADAIKRQEDKNSEPISRLKSVLVRVKKFVSLTESGISLLGRIKQIQSDGAALLEDFSVENFSGVVGSDSPELSSSNIV
jgi:DNA-binding MarR family transcriptional regulator